MNLDDTNNTFDEVSTIEDDSPVKPKTNPPTTEIHKADMNSLFDYKKNAFAFSGNKGGFSSWTTKPAQSLLKDLDNCKHGVYFGMRNSHFEGVGESSGTILKEFEKNYKELVKVADKVGSGDLVVRALNDMYAPIEPIGKFIRDEIANPEGLDKGDWVSICFPIPDAGIYEAIERDIHNYNKKHTDKIYALADNNKVSGASGTTRASFSSYIKRSSIEECEDMAKELSIELSLKYYERIITN